MPTQPYPRRAGARSVLVVDDQRTFADLLSGALAAQPDLQALGPGYDLATGWGLLEEHRPEVLVLDMHFDGDSRDGIDFCFDVRLHHPSTRVVLLSGTCDPSIVGRAGIAGASAVMAKHGSVEDLLRAVRGDGTGFWIDPLLLREAVAADTDVHTPALTRRESDVLAMLALGMDARSISGTLDISLNTCRSYIKALLGKFSAHSQLECVAAARRMGLLGDPVDRGGSGRRTRTVFP